MVRYPVPLCQRTSIANTCLLAWLRSGQFRGTPHRVKSPSHMDVPNKHTSIYQAAPEIFLLDVPDAPRVYHAAGGGGGGGAT